MMLRPLVDLAALDGGGHTEGVADRFAERLRAIDDEQPGQRRIEPPGEEIVEQGLDDDSLFSVAPSTTARTCLSPLPSTPIAATKTWSPTCRPSIWMTSRSSSERSEASQAFIFLRDSATKRRETADFEVPSPRAFARSPSGRRTARWYLRVDTFRTIRIERPLEQQVAVAQHLPALQTHLLASMVANPWPLHFHAAAVVADLALRMAPAITPTVPMATMSGPAHGRGVLLHHLGQGLDPGQETEPLSTLRRTASIASASGGIGNEVARAFGLLELRIFFPMVSFSLLGLQHPEPNGSRRATPTSTFQHRPGHLLPNKVGCHRRR